MPAMCTRVIILISMTVHCLAVSKQDFKKNKNMCTRINEITFFNTTMLINTSWREYYVFKMYLPTVKEARVFCEKINFFDASDEIIDWFRKCLKDLKYFKEHWDDATLYMNGHTHSLLFPVPSEVDGVFSTISMYIGEKAPYFLEPVGASLGNVVCCVDGRPRLGSHTHGKIQYGVVGRARDPNNGTMTISDIVKRVLAEKVYNYNRRLKNDFQIRDSILKPIVATQEMKSQSPIRKHFRFFFYKRIYLIESSCPHENRARILVNLAESPPYKHELEEVAKLMDIGPGAPTCIIKLKAV